MPKRQRLDLLATQVELMTEYWQQGMRDLSDPRVAEAAVSAYLTENQVKVWIKDTWTEHSTSASSLGKPTNISCKRRVSGYNLYSSSLKKDGIGKVKSEYHISTRATPRPEQSIQEKTMSGENEEPSAEPSSNEEPGPSGLGTDRKELISARTQDTTSRNDLFSHVKLPTFWKFNPEAWISHLEHKFSLYRIASQTNRYLLAVEAIPATDLALLRLPSASAQDCYDTLINEILRNFDKREDHLDFLLADLTLHGQSPKHLMRELMSAIGQENLTPPVSKLIRAKFLKALPPDVAIALASVEYENLQSLANKAHELLLLK
ncbi:unnamed protein product [Clavelina lepadiformis]|uniref:DUF7041 domain-containing protein n=1 Tax=Clavelina lepadiformis TaxID=159417 RepID=A0ABP0G413_CLALP